MGDIVEHQKTLSLDEVFEEDLLNEDFQKEDRLIKPYYDLVADIVNRRSTLGITQKELAKRANTFQSRISKIESGEHDFRLSTIIQIAEALETEVMIQLMPFEIKRANDFSKEITSRYSGLFEKLTQQTTSFSSSEEHTSGTYSAQDTQSYSHEQLFVTHYDMDQV